jgi:hypothetical protein
MTRLGELRTSDAFAPNCALIGEGQLADRIWTKPQFLELCSLMHNDNPSKCDFLLAYRDDQGRAKFARAKRVEMLRRASWAWETIGGKSKHKVGIGFYPASNESQTRWGAMDFDAHDGQAERARRFAIAAIDVLRRFRCDIDVILATSGSAGWHVFALTNQFFAVSDWTLLLKQVAAAISATIKPGECEIFPHEVRQGHGPMGSGLPGRGTQRQTNQVAFFSKRSAR